MSVLVVGAGVMGLAAATRLAEAGEEVTVVDRARGLGPEQCSWWAGGMLAPWCEGETAEPTVVELGRQAADWWDARTGGINRQGTLVLAAGRERGELRRFARRTGGHEPVGADAIARLEPDLAGRFPDGLFFAGEAHLDPRRALAALAERLRGQGVALRYGIDAANAPSAALTVDCRGLAARDRLPGLRGVRGEMMLVRTDEVRLSRPVRLLHPRHPLYVVPRADGVFMLGATMIESDDRRGASARAVLELLGSAYALHPAFAEAEVLEIGADVRPAFPDNLPRVIREGDTIFANGLYRHGFLLAPAIAERVAGAALPRLTEMQT
ncbi:MAG TPA: FAD-dependent oxidoreductase [Thermohalobaculum sp.]|nr:FAD-dependent oxidoreductase [Thermohalobaculum sp.]